MPAGSKKKENGEGGTLKGRWVSVVTMRDTAELTVLPASPNYEDFFASPSPCLKSLNLWPTISDLPRNSKVFNPPPSNLISYVPK